MNASNRSAIIFHIVWLALLLALVAGCGKCKSKAEAADIEPFQKAVAEYLERNNMAMALKEVKDGPVIKEKTATLTASLTHATMGGPHGHMGIHAGERPQGRVEGPPPQAIVCSGGGRAGHAVLLGEETTMKHRSHRTAGILLVASLGLGLCGPLRAEAEPKPAEQANLWDLAKSKRDVHRFSTLISAQQVRDYLSTEKGIDAAIDWCKKTAVSKVYLEVFRDGYQAQRDALRHGKERFQAAGIEVSGCVTTTQVGKGSNGWRGICCYTDRKTQDRLQEIFEYAAGLFDEIMIDDFWFTDCKCSDCDAARKAKTVTIGEKTYPVTVSRTGILPVESSTSPVQPTWEDYRCELMVRLSQDRVLAAAKKVNPRATLIIKYPQWYDNFHERGYEVLRETADFDRTWVGTETRNYADRQWGGTPQYEAFFIMRWLGGIGGPKCGGGWYDPYGTTEPTYVEQARQTVLGGARESLLFCYGSLLTGTGPKNVAALRENIPELVAVAEQVGRREIVGVAAYKPPNSHPENEPRVFDFVGMMGLPLVPCHQFPADAKAAFFSVHALKDPDLAAKLSAFIAAGKPVLVTDGLVQKLTDKVDLKRPNVRVLPVKGEPKGLLSLPQEELDAARASVLRPLGRSFHAPNRVALYLYGDGSWVVENFNDQPVTAELDGKSLSVPPRGWTHHWQ
jgi:hypothetical protein